MNPQDDARNRLAVFGFIVFTIVGGMSFVLSRAGLDINQAVTELQTQFEALNLENDPSSEYANDYGKLTVGTDDYDGDGLNDMLEAMLASDQEVADTDGDGYSDYEEFLASYDPLTPDASLEIATVNERITAFLDIYEWQYDLHPEAWFWAEHGYELRQNNALAKAAVSLERSLSIEPNIQSYWQAFYAYADQKLYKRADDIVTRYLRDFPDDWGGYYQRGNLKQKQGITDGVLADYDKALSLGAEYVWLYNNYAVILGDNGDEAGARDLYIKALELESEHPLIEENLAATYHNLGDEAEAALHEAHAKELREQGYDL